MQCVRTLHTLPQEKSTCDVRRRDGVGDDRLVGGKEGAESAKRKRRRS
jgi:hypothetical protein